MMMKSYKFLKNIFEIFFGDVKDDTDRFRDPGLFIYLKTFELRTTLTHKSKLWRSNIWC